MYLNYGVIMMSIRLNHCIGIGCQGAIFPQ